MSGLPERVLAKLLTLRLPQLLVTLAAIVSSQPATAVPIDLAPGDVVEVTLTPDDEVEFTYTVDPAFVLANITIAGGSDIVMCGKDAFPVKLQADISSVESGFIASVGPGVYSSVTPAGVYTMKLFWNQNLLDQVFLNECTPPSTLTAQILLQVTPLQDRQEPDDAPEEARWIGLNGSGQVHALTSQNDEDWMTFVTSEESTITITITEFVGDVDAIIDLYAGDATTLLATNEAILPNPLELEYDNTTPGQFYIRIFPRDEVKGGGIFVVEAKSSGVGGIASLAGYVLSEATNDPVAGVDVVVEEFAASVKTGADGFYQFDSLPAENVFVTVQTSPGFQSSSAPITLGAGINQLDFALAPGTGGGGCFIATAAYGTPFAAEVNQLRLFRDAHLLTNPPGTMFTDLYYAISPPVAGLVAKYPAAAWLVRLCLSPLVALLSGGWASLLSYTFALTAAAIAGRSMFHRSPAAR